MHNTFMYLFSRETVMGLNRTSLLEESGSDSEQQAEEGTPSDSSIGILPRGPGSTPVAHRPAGPPAPRPACPVPWRLLRLLRLLLRRLRLLPRLLPMTLPGPTSPDPRAVL